MAPEVVAADQEHNGPSRTVFDDRPPETEIFNQVVTQDNHGEIANDVDPIEDPGFFFDLEISAKQSNPWNRD